MDWFMINKKGAPVEGTPLLGFYGTTTMKLYSL